MALAHDIHQVQLPLPFPLRIVNVYLVRDGSGWAVVDAGLHYPAGQEAWHAAFATFGIDPRSISRIVLTHAHPDHYGMSGWLQQLSSAPVLLSAGEAAFARRQWHADSFAHDTIAKFFGAHGMPAPLMTTVTEDIAALRQMTHPIPSATSLMTAGETLVIGDHSFMLISTPGHSDDHLALYCANERLLLCGDAVLIKITPNVGLWGDGQGNPLARFLESLDRMATLDVALALPGHGPPITQFHERLDELRTHHMERLSLMEYTVGDGASAYDVCTAVFPLAELTSHQMRFAMAETLAHLEYLVSAGRLKRTQYTIGTRYRRLIN